MTCFKCKQPMTTESIGDGRQRQWCTSCARKALSITTRHKHNCPWCGKGVELAEARLFDTTGREWHHIAGSDCAGLALTDCQ